MIMIWKFTEDGYSPAREIELLSDFTVVIVRLPWPD